MEKVTVVWGGEISASARFPHILGPIMPDRINAAVGWCWRAEAGGEGHAGEVETEQRSRRRARQSIREYESIWLLQQRLRAVSWPHWRLRCMQPLHGHHMGVVRP